MVIVRTDWTSFEAYLASLSKPARKNYKEAVKRYGHFSYSETFNTSNIESFMQVWERQLVRGKPIQWAFPIGHVINLYDKGQLKLFSCELGMQFIQKREGYWECHPPMYDKKHEGLGTYLWFELIRFAIENKLEHLNLGGGIDEWRAMIKRRDEFPNPKYKWRFVPQKAKDYPETEPDFYIEECQLLLKDS